MYPRRLVRTGRPSGDHPPGRGTHGVLARWREGHFPMSSAAYRWIRRLSRFATFTPDEQRALEEVSAVTRRCAVSDDLAKVGDPADRVLVILEGLACRHKLLPDGRRQILAYMFPGDMGDPRQVLQSRVDYSMCVLWPTEIATLSLASIQRLERYANISS